MCSRVLALTNLHIALASEPDQLIIDACVSPSDNIISLKLFDGSLQCKFIWTFLETVTIISLYKISCLYSIVQCSTVGKKNLSEKKENSVSIMHILESRELV